jgi:mRNA interferase MazF
MNIATTQQSGTCICDQWANKYPSGVEVHHSKKVGWIVLDQVRIIDKGRIIKVSNRLGEEEIAGTAALFLETFGEQERRAT